MKKTIVATLILASFGVLTAASAADTQTTNTSKATPKIPPALAGAIRTGVILEKSFPAESGMTGYVLKHNGQYSIAYGTPDKKTLVNGILIAADGRNLATEYEAKYIPKPDLEKLWPALEKASIVTTGAKGAAVKSVVYAFIDPNCGFCHLAWMAFKPYAAAGLQVRWLPVAFLGPTSAPKSAYVMQSADPGDALDKFEIDFKNGGVDAKTLAGVVVKPETQAKLEANSQVMKSFGFGGTPAMVWRDASGKVVSKNGMPRLSELPGMFGLPPQPNNEPELERFQ